MRKKGKKPAWIPFLLPPLPPMWTSPWLRWLPSLHKVNVPSWRTNLAQSVWTAAHSEIPRLEKAPLAVCHLLNMRLMLAGLDARFLGGILEACGSAITNRSALSAIKVESVGQRLQRAMGFLQFHVKETQRFHPEGRKRREENEVGTWEIMFYELSGDEQTASRKSGAISQATSTQPSGKWMIWRRADMSKFTLTLILASLLPPQRRIKLLNPSGLICTHWSPGQHN